MISSLPFRIVPPSSADLLQVVDSRGAVVSSLRVGFAAPSDVSPVVDNCEREVLVVVPAGYSPGFAANQVVAAMRGAVR